MSGFAIRNPYFIVVVCLIVAVVGASSLIRMPVDIFPSMDIPVVVVATFYNGMPPEQIHVVNEETISVFTLRNPYFIVVVCLIVAVVVASSLIRMPVDMFPSMDIPVVVVATFYNGMPPEQIHDDNEIRIANGESRHCLFL